MGPGPVVGEVPRPEPVPDECHLLCGVFDDVPSPLGVVVLDLVQEVKVVDALVSVDLLSLLPRLSSSEVLIALNLECLGGGSESSERLVLPDFLDGGHLETADWHDLAIVLNAVDYMGEAIELSHSLRRNLQGLGPAGMGLLHI